MPGWKPNLFFWRSNKDFETPCHLDSVSASVTNSLHNLSWDINLWIESTQHWQDFSRSCDQAWQHFVGYVHTGKEIVSSHTPYPVKAIYGYSTSQVEHAYKFLFNPEIIKALEKPKNPPEITEAIQNPKNPPEITEAIQNPKNLKTRHTFIRSVQNSLSYALPFFIYRQLTNYCYPTADSSGEYILSYQLLVGMGTLLLIAHQYPRMALDDAVFTKLLSNHVMKENENDTAKFPLSKNQDADVYIADTVVLGRYYVDKGASFLIENVPKPLKWLLPKTNFAATFVAYLFKANSSGYGFYDYKFSQQQMNTAERQDRVSSNAMSVFLVGLSYVAIYELTVALMNFSGSFLMNMEPPEDSNFFYQYIIFPAETAMITFPIAAFYSKIFMMLAYLMDKPLPNAKGGLDLFYPTKAIIDLAVRYCGDFIKKLRESKQDMSVEDIKLMIDKFQKRVSQYPMLDIASKGFLYDDLSSVDAILKKDHFFELWKEYEEGVKKFPNKINSKMKDIKSSYTAKALNGVTKVEGFLGRWFGIQLPQKFKKQTVKIEGIDFEVSSLQKIVRFAFLGYSKPIVGFINDLVVQTNVHKQYRQEEDDALFSRQLAENIKPRRKEKNNEKKKKEKN